MPWGQVLWSIIGILVIIVAAYFSTYIIAVRSVRKTTGRGIKLLDNFSLSKDRSVCALEISGRVYIIAMSSGAATLLDTRDAEEYLSSASASSQSMVNFEAFKKNAVFSKFMDIARRVPDTSSKKKEPQSGIVNEEDDLDIISKKINMRRQRPGSDSDDG